MVRDKVLSPLLSYIFLSLFRYLIFFTCSSNNFKLINHDIYISCVVFLNFWLIKFLIYTLLGTVYISFLSSAHFHWVLYFDQCQVNLSAHLVAAYSLSLWRFAAVCHDGVLSLWDTASWLFCCVTEWQVGFLPWKVVDFDCRVLACTHVCTHPCVHPCV